MSADEKTREALAALDEMAQAERERSARAAEHARQQRERHISSSADYARALGKARSRYVSIDAAGWLK